MHKRKQSLKKDNQIKEKQKIDIEKQIIMQKKKSNKMIQLEEVLFF